MAQSLSTAARLLREARRSVIFTGAGVSAESGIPTFRDAQVGLWENYRPEDLATPDAFRRQPELVLGFYDYRRTLIRQCQPNAAHAAIAELERRQPGLVVVTQNVDGFHQAAGSRQVLELHGDIFRDRCNDGCPGVLSGVERPEDGGPARCPTCGERTLRPAVVWFGEGLDSTIWAVAEKAVDDCDFMMIIGTSGMVYPAASLPLQVLAANKPLIEINPDVTPFSEAATLHFECRAADLLPLLLEEE